MGFTRNDLKDLDKVWKDGITSGSASESDIPEGKYQAKVKEVELGKSSGGRPQCKWVWKIIGGSVEEVIGKEHTTYDGLQNAESMGYFFKKLRRLQIKPPESFEDMDEAVQKAVGAVVDIQVKVKDDFTNVYVNKLVKAGAGAAKASDDDDEAGKDEEEDEKPKKGATAAADDEDEAPRKPSKKPADDDDDEEAKPKGKAAAEDDEDEKPAKGKASEDDDEGGKSEEDEEKPARNFPTLKEIDGMPEKGVRKLLKQFKVDPAEGKKESVLKAVAKVLVSVMEDDDYDAPEGDLRIAVKWFGLEPEEGKKKLLRQVVQHLGG